MYRRPDPPLTLAPTPTLALSPTSTRLPTPGPVIPHCAFAFASHPPPHNEIATGAKSKDPRLHSPSNPYTLSPKPCPPPAYTTSEAPRLRPSLFAALLTPVALLIHGYHPYAEDGGLYVTGIKHLLHPALYPHSLPFVEAHLRFSLFAPALAAAVRLTHLSLPIILLVAYLACIWLTLLSVAMLATRCYTSLHAAQGAMILAIAFLTLPVAGTSLVLFDPYLTARSITLPCTLLALCGTFDLLRSTNRLRSLLLCILPLLAAALVHPLMAGYALAAVLLLATLLAPSPRIRLWGTATLCLAGLLIAATLQATAPPESPAYLPVALSRYYWFLVRWHWYELLGLLAPLAILTPLALRRRTLPPLRALARMALTLGTTAILIALLFAGEAATTHLVARLQPLRVFQTVYMLLILVLGAALGDRLLRSRLLPSLATLALLGGILFAAQRVTYPASAHIEWPGRTPANLWQQAFVWIRNNTPPDALFALDAHYIQSPDEDAQNFRAIAERSVLPDYSKDGGEASITPALTDAWTTGVHAQTRVNESTDAQRRATLHPLGVDWIVLDTTASTTLPCPWHNARVQVCRLP